MEDEYWINVCGSLLTTWKGLDDVKERNMSSLCEFLDKMSNDMSLTRDERRMASTWGPTLAHVSNLSSPSLSSWSQARDFPGVGLVELPSSFDTQSTALALRALTRAIAPWSSSAATPASQRRFVLIEEPQNLDAYAVDLILGNDLSI
jgi:hypothetical protein